MRARPTAVSMSASGDFCAVTLRDGRINLFELCYGERLASVNTEQVLAEARQARDGGNFGAAIDLLRARLLAVPSETLSADALAETLSQSRESFMLGAENAEAVGDFRLADTRLAEVIAQNGFDSNAVESRSTLRKRWTAAMQGTGRSRTRCGRWTNRGGTAFGGN